MTRRCKACRAVNIHPSMHCVWTKQTEVMMEQQKKHNVKAKSTNSSNRISWTNKQTICWPLSLNYEKKGMGDTIPIVVVKAAKFPNISIIKPDWPNTTTLPAGLFALMVLSFTLELTNPSAPHPRKFCRCIGFYCESRACTKGFGTNKTPGFHSKEHGPDSCSFFIQCKKTLESFGGCRTHCPHSTAEVYRQFQGGNLCNDSFRKGFETSD